MTRQAAAVAVTAALFAPLVPVRDADACSFPDPIELGDEVTNGLTGVPTSGIVSLYARVDFERIESGFPRMTVVDSDGIEVAGAIELFPSRLVWRADAPLAPNATYAATLAVDSWRDHAFSFTTGATAALPSMTIAVADSTLSEVADPDEEICCDLVENSCGGQDYLACWTQTVITRPHLEATFAVDVEAARYYDFSYEAPGALRSYSGVGSKYGSTLSATFAEPRDAYCATVRARRVSDGAEVQTELCVPATALEPLPPFVAQTPDRDQCEDALVDPATNEPVELGDGCSLGGRGSTSGALAALLGLAGLALIRTHRRRAQPRPVRR